MKANAANAAKLLDSVHPDVIIHFEETAKEFIEKLGAVPALAAALAHMAGTTQPESVAARSLLTGKPGYSTVILWTSGGFSEAKRQIYRFTSNPEDLRAIKGGFVFDAQKDIAEGMVADTKEKQEKFSTVYDIFEMATSLDQFEVIEQARYGSGRGGRGGYSSSWGGAPYRGRSDDRGGRGGRGGGRGGRGGGRGGRGGRGGGRGRW